jgi:hypothetical protein
MLAVNRMKSVPPALAGMDHIVDARRKLELLIHPLTRMVLTS